MVKSSIEAKYDLKQFALKIDEINKNENDNVRKEQGNFRWVELFFSFDIVNSSIYKTINHTTIFPNHLVSQSRTLQSS